MATPPRSRSPIVFSLPGTQPDVRLKVFDDVEFHVHSIILKAHSAFFGSFLDPSNRQTDDDTSSTFRYEWVTKLDDDGAGWHLIAAPKNVPYVLNMESFSGLKEPEQTLFESLLRAFYNQPYSVMPEDLLALTELADYYRGLPTLSRSLDGVFFRNPEFMDSLLLGLSKSLLAELLQAAVKLRHPQLYRDCLSLSIGPWHRPYFERFKEGDIKNAAQNLYSQVCVKVAKVHLDVLDHSTRHPDSFETEEERDYGYEFVQKLRGVGRMVREDEEDMFEGMRLDVKIAHLSLPAMYRKVYTSEEYASPLWVAIGRVLEGSLMLDGRFQAGVGDCHNHFLCGKIEDRDLPWDLMETDW